MLAALAALVFAAMYFYTALPRLVYPYDLDFDEDSILMQSLRLAQGQPVYIAPNAIFNPHVYMPLFFWLGSLVLSVTGPSIPALRLISLAATLATTLLIYWIARRESGARWMAIACAGLYLGGYRINGFWYEIVRVDSLFVALMLGALTLGIYSNGAPRLLVLAAIVMALAAFTKQSGLIVGSAFALDLFFLYGRRAFWFALSFAALTLLSLLALNASTSGWFFYHVFTIGSADPIEFGRIVSYVAFDLFGVMASLSLMAIAAAVLGLRHTRNPFTLLREQPWLLAILFAVLISGLGRARVGGNLNNRMPAYALLCLAPALLMLNWRGLSAPLMRWCDALLAGLIVIQFALGIYFPPRYIPTAQMYAAGNRFIRRIAATPGNVLVMMHPSYALRAGKDPSTQIATLWYVRDRGALPFPDDFATRLRDKYYTAIISDQSDFETDPALLRLLSEYYQPSETLTPDDAPPTTTGVVVQPGVIYRPKP